MQVILEHSLEIQSITIQHLMGWIECLSDILGTDENPFDDIDELAACLERWRHAFQSRSGCPAVIDEPVKVMTYGSDVILLCNELTGEWVKLTVTPENIPHNGA